MSLPEDGKQSALKREWAVARIVVIGGLVVAIAVAGYFAWRVRQEQLAAATPVVHTVAPQKIDPKVLARIEAAVCTAELLRAKDIGAVPTYGELATTQLVRVGNAPRRFICEAKTHLTNYFIAADVLCNKLADPRCVSVYRVATKGKLLIYARPE